MKKILLSIVIIIISFKSNAQNAYYDALFCSSLNLEDASIKNYDGTMTFNEADTKILKDLHGFLNTPFDSSKPDMGRVRAIFQKIKATEQTSLAVQGFAGTELFSLISPMFGLSNLPSAKVDTILYGLTIYFADEFRKGYMQTYMKGVEKSIGKAGELQILFPQTYKKILNYDPFRYKDFGNEIKGVFDEDLSASLTNLKEYIDTVSENSTLNMSLLKYKTIKDFRELESKKPYTYLNISLDMAQKLINGVHPADVMGYLDENYYNNSVFETCTGEVIHLLNILQRNLRDTSQHKSDQFSNVWINFEKLAKLNNPKTMAYFLAFVNYEDLDFFTQPRFGIDFTSFRGKTINQLTIGTDLKSLTNIYSTLKKEKLTSLLSILVKIDEYSKLKGKNILEEQNFEVYLKNIGELAQLINLISKAETSGKVSKQIDKYLSLTEDVFQIYNGVRIKNYSNLSTHLFNIIQIINPKIFKSSAEIEDLKDKISEVDNLVTALVKSVKKGDTINKNNDNIKQLLANIQNLYNLVDLKSSTVNSYVECLKSLTDNDTISLISKNNSFIQMSNDTLAKIEKIPFAKFVADYDRITSFASGMISAKTSDDVNNVIKKFADPPTSYADKRNNGFRITIGGMPGLKFDFEKTTATLLKKDKTDSISISANGKNIGLSLPIGLDFTFGDFPAKGYSIGLFAQAIDLGAMLNYRLTSNAKILPDSVSLKSVLSPGLSFSIGFPNSPITFQIGYHWGPVLRNISVDSKTTIYANNASTGSFHFRLSYDIPLFSLKGRKYP